MRPRYGFKDGHLTKYCPIPSTRENVVTEACKELERDIRGEILLSMGEYKYASDITERDEALDRIALCKRELDRLSNINTREEVLHDWCYVIEML